MDQISADNVVRACLREIARNLDEASAIAKAAQLCAETGNVKTALKMAMDFEDRAHLAQQMLNTALIIKRELLSQSID